MNKEEKIAKEMLEKAQKENERYKVINEHLRRENRHYRNTLKYFADEGSERAKDVLDDFK